MRRLILMTTAIALIGFGAPSGAQSQDPQLQEAVEAQRWTDAIVRIDQLIREQPAFRETLLDYRDQLVELAGPDVSIPALPVLPTPTPAPESPSPAQPLRFQDPEGEVEATIDVFDGTFVRGRVTNTGEDLLFNIQVVYELIDQNGDVVATESVLTVPREASAGQTVYYDATTPAEGPGFQARLEEVRWETN